MSVNPKICATLALYFWWGVTSAQSYLQRIVVVDKSEILNALPVYHDAMKYLDDREKTWRREEEELMAELGRVKDEVRIGEVMSPVERVEEKRRRCDDLQRVIDSMKVARYAPGGEYEKEYKRVVGPILGVIKREIENYAVRNKVSMVLDKKERGVLYVDNFSDISTLILEKVKKNYKKE